jgi:sugar-phosphatase
MLTKRTFAAFLFDMDGTVLDSMGSATRVWGQWALRHGLDPDAVVESMPGVRAIETIRHWGIPEDQIAHEVALLTQGEMDDVDGIAALAGAEAFLAALPPERWAIVTSAPKNLALRRLGAAGLAPPPVFVTAEDVSRGKPAPDCFLLAAERLGVDPRECLIWEDAAAGVAAGVAAGATVMVVSATHTKPMVTDHAMTKDYQGLSVVVNDAGLTLVG